MTGGYYDSTDRGMRIRVLQRMLRALAEPDVRENGQYDEVTREAVRRFQQILEDGGVPATVRRTLGGDIDASCGQLRRKYKEKT